MRRTTIVVRWLTLVSAVLLTWSAQATPVTVASDISNIFMGTASSTTGRFDVNASAAALGFSSPMNATSATLSFQFSDNTDPYATISGYSGTTSLVQGATTCGSTLGSCVEHYYWVDPYSTTNSDPIETARVTVGNQTANASSPYHLSTVGPYLTAQGSTSCSFFGCGFIPVTRSDCGTFLGGYFCTGPWPVYTQNWTYYSAYDGNFSLSLTLDAAGLLDLSSDGLLDFSLSAFAGDFNFLSASLTADIFERTDGPDDPIDPVDPVPPVGVPEPATPAMLLTGVLMLLVRKRKELRYGK
jgi:hypothetical protein